MTSEPIAVIGIGCRLPGGAHGVEKLWQLIAEGRSAWSEVPTDRWNSNSFYHPHPEATESVNTRGGYFLQEDVSAFDPAFFNISSMEAHVMDPQQRILLETTYESLENAGISLDMVKGSDTSVYISVFSRDYDRMGYKDVAELSRLHVTGTGDAIISNRISYVFDLKGASVTVDTGCSGSLVALHQACQGLRTRESSMAIVGGTQLMLHPDQTIPMSMAGFINPDGKCYVFDDRGSGYGRGEGVATLVLKRLDDAMRQGDAIHAVIRNTGLNQDGRTASITLPDADAQAALMRHVYESVGLDPGETSYVEAHGTGTQAGDNAEISSIASVFCDGVKRENPLLVGSIKSNIGHLEASSGIAGIIKGIMILKKGLVPSNINLATPKKTLRLGERGIKIPQELTSLASSGIRRVSVNNFGYGGTNAHVILESAPEAKLPIHGLHKRSISLEVHALNGNTYPENGTSCSNGASGIGSLGSTESINDKNIKNLHAVNGNGGVDAVNGATSQKELINQMSDETPQLYILTAKTKESLFSNMANLSSMISSNEYDESSLRDLAYTLSNRRSIMQWRTSFVTQNRDQLLATLSQKRAVKASQNTRVMFLFTGQGAQWIGMGRELMLADSTFRKSIRKSDEVLRALGCEWSLLEELLRDASTSRISQSEISQPATTAIQIAIVDQLSELAITPWAVLGHSSGEIAAAYAAGALSHETAIEVSYRRGFISSFCKRAVGTKGAMLAVGAGEIDVAQYIHQIRTGVLSIACVNSPRSTTISGDEAAVDELKEILDGAAIFNRKLQVDTAYHSHHMKKVATEYLDSLRSINDSPLSSKVKFYSSVSAGRKLSDFSSSYWVENLVSRVRFSDGLEALCRSEEIDTQHAVTVPTNIFIEIGPHSALSGPIKQIMTEMASEDFKHVYLPSLVRNQNALRTLLELTGRLFECGSSVNLGAISRIEGSKEIRRTMNNLPPYSWDHSGTYWRESRLSHDHRLRLFPHHDLLGLLVVGSPVSEPVWRNHIGIEALPWLRDHVVDGLTVFPGSGYLSMAIEASRQIKEIRQIPGIISSFVFKDVLFSKALMVPEQRPDGLLPRVEVQLTMKPVKNTADRNAGEIFRIFSIQNGHWSEHCSGIINIEVSSEMDEVEGTREHDLATAAYLEDLRHKTSSCDLKIDPREMYDQLKASGNAYGPTFALIREAHLADYQGIATIVVPDLTAHMPHGFMQPHIIHPTTFDALVQLSTPLHKRHLGSGAVMPVSVREITIAAHIFNKPGSKFLVTAEMTPESSKSSLFDIVAFQTSHDGIVTPVVTFTGAQLRVIGDAQASDVPSPFHREMTYNMKWITDIDYIEPKMLAAAANGLPYSVSLGKNAIHRKMSTADELRLHEQAAAICIRSALNRFAREGLPTAIKKDHLSMLLDWIIAYSKSEEYLELLKGMTEDDYNKCLLTAKEQGAEGEMVTRIGEQLTPILMNEVDPLALMLEDGLLNRCYAENLTVANTLQMVDYLKLLTFKNRQMKIIEVGAGTGGATLPLFQSLSQVDGLHFSHYDFTDVSAGFFDSAEMLLRQWTEYVDFKTLDISRDPVPQGFIAGSYDLVIAANVLHATPSIETTLANVQKLLKPGGRLILIEITRVTAPSTIVFGTLPGWWAAEDGRKDGPLLSVENWDSALTRNGFNGVEFSTPDFDGPTQRSTLIVSKSVGDTVDNFKSLGSRTVELLCSSSGLQDLAAKLSRRFTSNGLQSSTSSWDSNQLSLSSIYVVLDDLDQPLLFAPTPGRFEQIRNLLVNVKSVLWISGSAGSMPLTKIAGNEGLVNGLARVIRNENEGMKFVTFHTQQGFSGIEEDDHLLQVVSDVLFATFCPASEGKRSNETEYTYKEGRIHINRVVADIAFNKWVKDEVGTPQMEVAHYHQPQRPLKLYVESPGLLSSMYFVDDGVWTPQMRLAPDELQIEVRAYGVNFKDVFIALGQMLPHFKMTGECCGVVVRVGSNFTSQFKVGDRICAVGAEPFSSRPRVKGHLAFRLPSSMSFIVGASIPVVFLTAYHCLVEIARIRKGQTVLIHAASGGVGQAAIMLAQYAGAEIFATVGSTEKRQLLIDKFDLPESHIFSTRSRTFKQGVLRLTKNRGVDVVLNSLSGEMLSDSWACIAPMGTFLEIGKADIMKRNQLSMAPFDRHVIFAAVDLTILFALRPEDMAERFSKILSLFEAGHLRPVEPILTMPITNIEDAFRLIQSRKHTGKVVLEADEGTMVKVVQPRPPPLQLNAEGTYIVAGGLGDLGRKICRLLAANGAKDIVTFSRKMLDVQQQQTFEDEILTLGAKLHAIACDITDVSTLEKCASDIRRDLPVVKGIIHAGMVLRDHPMEQMELDDYNTALAPKVTGTRNLDKAFNSAPLDFFIMLSSVACIIGKTGQGNYSAGNAFQDAFAHAQSQFNTHTRYISLNLGAIEGSEVCLNPPTRQQEFIRAGFILMQFEELFKLLEYSMNLQVQQERLVQAVVGFDRQSMEPVLGSFVLNRPLLSQLPITEEGNNFGEQKAESVDIEKSIRKALTLVDAEAIIIKALAERLAYFSAVPIDEVDQGVPLTTFGLDSLVTIELKNWISRNFHAPMQTSEVMDASNVVQLGRLVASRSSLINTGLQDDSTGGNSSAIDEASSPVAIHRYRCCRSSNDLPKLPLIGLDQMLELFLDNVRAISTSGEYNRCVQAVSEFKSGGSVGRKLYDRLLQRYNHPQTDYWLAGLFEENTWLSTRASVAPYASFMTTHRRGPVQLVQAEAAAIIASTAFKFKEAVESDTLEPHLEFGAPQCMDSWQWLFNAPREPQTGCDRMRKFSGDEYNYLIAMRRGHIFKINLKERGATVSLEGLTSSFQAILEQDIENDSWIPILTSDNRDSWAQNRDSIRVDNIQNQKYLSVIEGAAFAICLDESTPEEPAEMVRKFYLNDGFNRWFDCALQFIVASNGTSGTCVNHTMIDGMSYIRLNDWITEALHSHPTSITYHNGDRAHRGKFINGDFEEYSCTVPPAIQERIMQVRHNHLSNTSRVEYLNFRLERFGKEVLTANSLAKGTIDLTIQLATRLYFGYSPAAWEARSMAHFHRGRPELVQVLTQAVESFCSAALDSKIGVSRRHELFLEAVKEYTNNLRNTNAGKGYHRALEVMRALSIKDGQVPTLFTDPVYLRQATGTLLSTGTVNESSTTSSFVMSGDPKAMWLVYSVSENGIIFHLVSQTGSTQRFSECLNTAADAIKPLLLFGRKS